MFCVNCGSIVRDDQNFCTGCGSRVKREAASQAAQPLPDGRGSEMQRGVGAQGGGETHGGGGAQGGGRATVCPWCAASVDAWQSSCPRCGAAIGLPVEVAQSGWAQLPGRKDMAKLQFGRSSCQIEGLYVPVADMNLAAGDSVYFTHHVLLWKDPQVNVSAMSLRGGWKRLFAGLPLIMTQAEGPGHIAFSKDAPGEVIPIPLQQGEGVDVREHVMLAATSNVAYDWFDTGIWFQTKNGDDTETHYPIGMYMDQFTAPDSPGLLLLHAAGNVFIRELQQGQTILVKPTALLFKDPTVQMELHFEHPASASFFTWGSWSNRYLWLRLYGPGRVAVQSVFERLEGEARNITNCSYATEARW